jgi:outer membrane protein assembly factor BamB
MQETTSNVFPQEEAIEGNGRKGLSSRVLLNFLSGLLALLVLMVSARWWIGEFEMVWEHFFPYQGPLLLTERSDIIAAFRADTGKVLWQADQLSPSSAIAYHGTIYVLDKLQRDVYALRSADGQKLWSAEAQEKVALLSILGIDATRVYILEKDLINSTQGEIRASSVMALDVRTGQKRWIASLDKNSDMPPTIDFFSALPSGILLTKDSLLLCNNQADGLQTNITLSSLNIANGTVNSQVTFTGDNTRLLLSSNEPLSLGCRAVGSHIYVEYYEQESSSITLVLINPNATGFTNVITQYGGYVAGYDQTHLFIIPATVSFTSVTNVPVVTSQAMTAINFTDGNLQWTRQTDQASTFMSPAHLVVINSAGLVRINQYNGATQWEWPYTNRDALMSAIFNEDMGNILYIADSSSLYALDEVSGHVLWKKDLMGKNLRAMLSDQHALYTSSDKLIMAINKATGQVIWQQNGDATHFIPEQTASNVDALS